jgi:hypothetical protein
MPPCARWQHTGGTSRWHEHAEAAAPASTTLSLSHTRLPDASMLFVLVGAPGCG